MERESAKLARMIAHDGDNVWPIVSKMLVEELSSEKYGYDVKVSLEQGYDGEGNNYQDFYTNYTYKIKR